MQTSFTILFLFFISSAYGQILPDSANSAARLKDELLAVRADVDNIQLNLGKSQTQFKKGIVVATLGYSVTIAGGLMLGRKRDELGKALLIAGGVTGITGTFLMVDAFKFLGRAARKRGASR